MRPLRHAETENKEGYRPVAEIPPTFSGGGTVRSSP